MMAFRRSDLQEAFFVPGTYAFRVYGYGTTDPLEAVLGRDYFAAARGLLRPGELIYLSMHAAETRGGAAPAAPRMALVMVRPDERDPAHAAGSVRLVQDFGRAHDPAGPVAPLAAPPSTPPKRGRGRPPGSKNQKPGVRSATGATPDAPSPASACAREKIR